jgi:hypothetical protein
MLITTATTSGGTGTTGGITIGGTGTQNQTGTGTTQGTNCTEGEGEYQAFPWLIVYYFPTVYGMVT